MRSIKRRSVGIAIQRAQLTPTNSYFICTLPRSGSWLLSESLEKTGIAGRPREYFEPKLFPGDISLADSGALERIVGKGMTKNRVFGAKFHWYQFEFTSLRILDHERGDVPVPLVMAWHFPGLRYVWLIRRDKIRQAISYYRASQTGTWWNIPGVNSDQPQPHTPEFDFAQIQYLEDLLLSHEAKWQKYFEENDIEPLVLVYEEFADDHVSAVKEVLSHIGVAPPRRLQIRPRLLRQADDLTEEWVERYTSLKGKQGMGGYMKGLERRYAPSATSV
jgi:trehalose 2-sulfotransferase